MATTDVLAQTLEALRLRGTVYFRAEFCAPWGMAIPAGKVAAFHVVANGECWLRMAESTPRRLARGDIILFPHGHAHELVHSANAQARPATEVLRLISAEKGEARIGGTGAATTLVCGHFDYDQQALHPFFQTLPKLIHISAGEEEQATWLATASRLAAAESASQQRGASAVVDRLAEALLMQTLRIFFNRSDCPRGFMAAVEDPQIGRALVCIHEAASRGWSVEDLARESGMSRSAFAQRFRELVGESPMRYVTRWRMLEARELLYNSPLSIPEVSAKVGYSSEFAFAKAFKRFFGEGPGAARRRSA